MPTDIIMPQMGESIVEGTITKWLKKPGDKVQRDEPLFEISTDKVDAEIPAPQPPKVAPASRRLSQGRLAPALRLRNRSRTLPPPNRRKKVRKPAPPR